MRWILNQIRRHPVIAMMAVLGILGYVNPQKTQEFLEKILQGLLNGLVYGLNIALNATSNVAARNQDALGNLLVLALILAFGLYLARRFWHFIFGKGGKK